MAVICLLPRGSACDVLPTPQYCEPLQWDFVLPRRGSVAILHSGNGDKIKVAVQSLRAVLPQHDATILATNRTATHQSDIRTIRLWDYALDKNPPFELNTLDRLTLENPAYYGQSYVVRVQDEKTVWVAGASQQGVLLGAMTVVELVRQREDGLAVPGVYIRDHPDFEFRAASDWLLNVEANRWTWDRGQGPEEFARLCERKLDRALRFKINMVLMDGFGWGLQRRFAGYGPLMRRLNQYARGRGIHLIFGGYGASYGMAYQGGPLYESAPYLGRIFKNREWYPDGGLYTCMGFPSSRKGVDPSVLGSCRANDELNRLKAEELRRFVEEVEPGALYIHHEDFGGFRGTEQVWRKRCERCRKRWPADSLLAADGGAGGLAHGYSALIQAVNMVKNLDTGYDASRDCQILLASPVYLPDSQGSGDWANAIELWRNIGEQLPRTGNVQVCFREVMPQQHGREKFTELFRSTIERAHLQLGVFLFYIGGADNYINDAPLSGAPAMNALFLGARSMLNASGDFYSEPMEVINAEYCWNTRSTGFFVDPRNREDALRFWNRAKHEEGYPPELFGKESLLERVCQRLYGVKAGRVMASYYKTNAWLPEAQRPASPRMDEVGLESEGYLPMAFDRLHIAPSLWRALTLDSHTWKRTISNEAYLRSMQKLRLDQRELHRRLARRWRMASDLHARGARYIQAALASDPQVDCLEDLRFLRVSFEVYEPLTQSLETFHTALHEYYSEPQDSHSVRQLLKTALSKAEQAERRAALAFPRPVDPSGGEVGSVRTYLPQLARAVREWLKGF